ncbi:MAG: sigma-70 family RNA polymerase sigma factor [Bacteroidota bacterium]
MTIQRLIKGCRKHDRKCQKELYLRYCQKAMNISMRYVQDIHLAKDVVQSAFIQVFTKIDLFDWKKGSFDNWLSRIVINEALQVVRQNKRILFQEMEALQPEKVEPPIVLDQLLAADIIKLVEQLPEGYRLVFLLSVVEGYKHQEIGEKLGISPSTSRSQLTRSKQLLRKLILNQNSSAHAS